MSLALVALLALAPPTADSFADAVFAARLAPQPARALALAAPVACDWLLQDAGAQLPQLWDTRTAPALERALLAKLGVAADTGADERAALEQWFAAAERRRAARLSHLPPAARRLIFAKHGPLGGSHYAYTEAQSDGQAERNFTPGTSLCLLTLDGLYGQVTTLVDSREGMIRDPDVSFDGRRVLFAWKRADRTDDFHLWELDTTSGGLRQLTFGLGVADYEGCYTSGGDIVFNSSRCVQTVDCWVTEVSNLYTCGPAGQRLRRLSFDQVHTNYPALLDDGRVTYTRWDYNDRGQIYPQGLFVMNPDGTGQTAFYGNNSWFPTTICHARGIPGTGKVLAIATGHHSYQPGQLIVIDPARGREENAGVQLLAPVRPTPAERIDAYGQRGPLFAYPYPLNEEWFLVSYNPYGYTAKQDRRTDPNFGVYLMNAAGERELLASDPAVSCGQCVPLAPRAAKHVWPNRVDYTQSEGTCYVEDIYRGPGLKGVPRGSAKTLRVIALDFRAAPIGSNNNRGPAGGAMSSTPPALSQGCWDVKQVLGDAPIHADGSAFFKVPARTPVYFQVLNERNEALQTMRTWATLQPGEHAACVGCHEDKNSTPPNDVTTQALAAGPSPLRPFHGPARGFSFAKEVQPLLDAKCVSCHRDRTQHRGSSARPPAGAPAGPVFSLLGEPVLDPAAKRVWSDAYLNLTNAVQRNGQGPYTGQPDELVNWVPVQSAPPMLPPLTAGAACSRLLKLLDAGHGNVKLTTAERDKLACWLDLLVPFCGDYREAGAWNPDEQRRYDHYLAKRERFAALEWSNCVQFAADVRPASALDEALGVQVLDAAGQVVATANGRAAPDRALTVELKRTFAKGDRLVVTGPKLLAVTLDKVWPEARCYAPDGKLDYRLPSGPEARPYPKDAFAGEQHTLTLRPLARDELTEYRNLAQNSFDQRGETAGFPHCTSNSECRGESVFAARNAIDGFTRNNGHGGWPVQSWGPDKRTDLWLNLDFGRTVELDQVVLWLRADFPHDAVWQTATLEFSDGSREPLTLRKTADKQVFRFARRATKWVKLVDLKQPEPLGWCAVMEFEAWGADCGAAGGLLAPAPRG